MEPFVDNLSQEEIFKLNAYVALIKKLTNDYAEASPNKQKPDLSFILSIVDQELGENASKEYMVLQNLMNGKISRPSLVQDAVNPEIMLAKNPEELSSGSGVFENEHDQWAYVNNTLGVRDATKRDPLEVLKNWSKYSKSLDKTIPKKKYVPVQHERGTLDKPGAPAYWNSENDFRRLYVAYSHESAETGGLLENIKKQVVGRTIPHAPQGEEAKFANDLLSKYKSSKPKELLGKYKSSNPTEISIEEEQRTILQLMSLLGGYDYFRTDLIGMEQGQVSLAQQFALKTNAWIGEQNALIDKLNKEPDEINKAIAQDQKKLKELPKEYEKKLAERTKKIKTLESEIKKLNKTINDLKKKEQAEEIEAKIRETSSQILSKSKERYVLAQEIQAAPTILKKDITDLNAKIAEEQKRIKAIPDEIDDINNQISKTKKHLEKVHAEEQKISGNIQERKELRKKVYDKLISLINDRKEVLDILTGKKEGKMLGKDGKLAPSYFSGNNDQEKALKWLESEEKGQADYYRWILSLDKSLDNMRLHNDIDDVTIKIGNVLNQRNQLDLYLNSHIDDYYTKDTSYGEMKLSMAADQQAYDAQKKVADELEKTIKTNDKNWKARYIELTSKQQALENEAKANDEAADDSKVKIAETKEQIKKLKELSTTLTKYSYVEDYSSLQGYETEMLQKKQMYDELTRHFEYDEANKAYRKTDEVSSAGIDFTGIGSSVRNATVYRYRDFTLAKYAIMQEFKNLEAAEQRGDYSEELESCRQMCIRFFGKSGTAEKLFAFESKTFSHDALSDEEWNAEKERFDKKANRVFGEGKCALFEDKYINESNQLKFAEHNKLVDALQSAKTDSELYRAVNKLFDEAEPFVNRLENTLLVQIDKQKLLNKKIKELDEAIASKEEEILKNESDINKANNSISIFGSKGRKLKTLNDKGIDLEEQKLSLTNEKNKIQLMNTDEIEYMKNAIDDYGVYLVDISRSLQDAAIISKDRDALLKSSEEARTKVIDYQESKKALDNDEKFQADLKEAQEKYKTKSNRTLVESINKEISDLEYDVQTESGYLKMFEADKERLDKEADDVYHQCRREKKEFDKTRKENVATLNKLADDLGAYKMEMSVKESIIKSEVPQMKEIFIRAHAKYGELKKVINSKLSIKKPEDIYSYVDKETGKVDLDKNNAFTQTFRNTTWGTLYEYYTDARKVTKLTKNEDSDEYLAMMNSLADVLGEAHYAQRWDQPMIEEGKLQSIRDKGVSIDTCFDRLKIANEKAQAYLDAKEGEFNLIASDIRKARLKAAREIIRETKVAMNALQGYDLGGNKTKTGGLIDRIHKMNDAYNEVIKPYGDPEKDMEDAHVKHVDRGSKAQRFVSSNPFEHWNEVEKKYTVGATVDNSGANAGTVVIKTEEDAMLETLFSVCVYPSAKQYSRDIAKQIEARRQIDPKFNSIVNNRTHLFNKDVALKEKLRYENIDKEIDEFKAFLGETGTKNPEPKPVEAAPVK